MNCWKACKEGFLLFMKHKKLWFQYYIINIVIAFLGTFTVFTFMNSQFGNTSALQGILAIYDFEIVTDILTNYGSGISVLFHQSFLWTIIFVFITAFLIGGIIKVYVEDHIADYWNHCASYFRKILGLALIFFLVQLGLLFLFLMLFNWLIPGISPDDIVSEVTALNQFKYLSIPYLMLVILISTIHDYSKIFLVNMKASPASIFKSIRKSIKFCCSEFVHVCILIWINLALLIGFIVLYKIIETGFIQDSFSMILLAFMLGQLSIMLRIALKFWNLANISRLCTLSKSSSLHDHT